MTTRMSSSVSSAAPKACFGAVRSRLATRMRSGCASTGNAEDLNGSRSPRTSFGTRHRVNRNVCSHAWAPALLERQTGFHEYRQAIRKDISKDLRTSTGRQPMRSKRQESSGKRRKVSCIQVSVTGSRASHSSKPVSAPQNATVSGPGSSARSSDLRTLDGASVPNPPALENLKISRVR